MRRPSDLPEIHTRRYPNRYVDYITFPDVVGERVRNEPAFANLNVRYTADFPKKAAEVPCIQWQRIRRVPGLDGQETRAPRLRETYYQGDQTGVDIFGQWQSVLFQFNCCARTSKEADDLLFEFERLMDSEQGTFLRMGARNVVFEEEVYDGLLPRTDDIEVRSLRYLAVLDKLDFRTHPVIDGIRLRVLHPFEEDYEAVVRSGSQKHDLLARTFIAEVLCVSAESVSGIARTEDFIHGLDFLMAQDPVTHQLALRWLDAGRQPGAGETYYVRYLYWSGFSRLLIP